MIDFAGAALGVVFGDLFKLVKGEMKNAAAFRGQLEKIQATLGDIEPIIETIDNNNDQLKLMGPIEGLLEQGKDLVNECSRIQAHNIRAKSAHSKKLAAFNAALLEKFQLYMPLRNAMKEEEMLAYMKEMVGKIKELEDKVITSMSVILRSRAFQSGPEALGDLTVPAAPDFIVRSEVVEYSRKLNKVGMSEAASEGEAVHEISTTDSQQFDFSTIRAATQQFEFGTLGASDNSAKKFQTSIEHSLFAKLQKMKWKKQQSRRSVEGEIVREIITAGLQQFDFGTIRAATDNFSGSKKLGEGGFGDVFKGQLSNGQEIAVKRLSWRSRQGEVQFKNEFMSLARLHHKNVVRLLGCCLEGAERLLIYKFMPNLSLDRFIFDEKCANLDWDRRHKIIMGVAQGIHYLHKDSTSYYPSGRQSKQHFVGLRHESEDIGFWFGKPALVGPNSSSDPPNRGDLRIHCTRACEDRNLLGQVGCIQFRSVGFGDCEWSQEQSLHGQ